MAAAVVKVITEARVVTVAVDATEVVASIMEVVASITAAVVIMVVVDIMAVEVVTVAADVMVAVDVTEAEANTTAVTTDRETSRLANPAAAAANRTRPRDRPAANGVARVPAVARAAK